MACHGRGSGMKIARPNHNIDSMLHDGKGHTLFGIFMVLTL
jgi:hypothetical protein